MRFGSRWGERIWLLPALAVLALIVGTAGYVLWGAATYGTLSDLTGRVLRVDTNGPAVQSGLQVGDVVLSLNDCPPVMWDGFRHPLYRPGDVHVLKFQREDEVYVTTVPAGFVPVRRWLAQLMVLVVALAFCLVSLVVWLSRPEALETRRFYVMCQIWAATLTVGALSTVGVTAASRWFGVLNGLVTPAMVHFHGVFPERRRLTRRRWSTALFYGLGGVVVALSLLWPIRAGERGGVLQTVIYGWLLLGVGVAIWLMVAAYLTTSSPYARRRIRLVVFGTVLGFGPFGVLTAAPIALFGGLVWDTWMLTIPLMSVLPVAYAVALWQYNLMGFDRALNRGLVYLVGSAMLFGTYFAALMLFYTLLPIDRVGSAAVGAAVALGAAITFRPLRVCMQRIIDRLFYSGWYDYRELTDSVGQSLACTLDPEGLVQVLVHQVPQVMHLPGAALWLEQKGDLVLIGRVGVVQAKAQSWIWGTGFDRHGTVRITADCAMVPLVTQEHVVGVWGLAARPNEEWGPEDRGILTTLGRHATLAAQNVRLVAALRTKVAEVEEVHRRLLAAREDERAELARELHDGIIQDLIGLRYRLEALQEAGGAQTDKVGEIYAQVGMLVVELRRLCRNLRPQALDQLGLAAALRALVREVKSRGLDVEAYLEDLSLPDRTAIGLYRIGREALSNVCRHARASLAIITLARQNGQVVLSVVDDGCGFTPARSRGRDGCMGLVGMAERAEALDGCLDVESTPGAGTRVTVRCDIGEASPEPEGAG